MALDPEKLLAMPPIVVRQKIAPRHVILYALGIGAEELAFAYEEGLQVLPTMAAALAYPGFFWRDPRMGVNWKKLLHGEVSVTLHAPLPVEASLIGTTTITDIYDKGPDKGAVVYQDRTIHDEAGTLIARVRNASMLRGDGGFGGTSEGQPKPHSIPDRVPDHIVPLSTRAGQALLYRIASGDMNPLHIDPEVAKAGGFPQPILHGLCTYGVAGRALVSALADNQPNRISRIDARFSSPVYPGETIITEIWRESDTSAAFRARVAERGLVVLNNGYVEFS